MTRLCFCALRPLLCSQSSVSNPIHSRGGGGNSPLALPPAGPTTSESNKVFFGSGDQSTQNSSRRRRRYRNIPSLSSREEGMMIDFEGKSACGGGNPTSVLITFCTHVTATWAIHNTRDCYTTCTFAYGHKRRSGGDDATAVSVLRCMHVIGVSDVAIAVLSLSSCPIAGPSPPRAAVIHILLAQGYSMPCVYVRTCGREGRRAQGNA